MIAAKPLQGLTRKLGRNAFDLPVAAFAGLAIAFLAFAMPAVLLERLVVATGLPHLLAAAAPPLGFKARFMLGAAGAAVAFGLAYALLRLLDSVGRRKASQEPEWDEADRPRLRRRDLHPDAPVCRPISAARDFGEPAPPSLEPDEPQVPVWLDEASKPVVAEERPVALWADEPEEPLELADRPAPRWLAEPDAEPEVAAQMCVHEFEAAPEPHAEASLPELMRRLEQGLARRRTRQVFAATPPQHAPAPQVFPEADDDRLQSAIESLQRFAARGE